MGALDPDLGMRDDREHKRRDNEQGSASHLHNLSFPFWVFSLQSHGGKRLNVSGCDQCIVCAGA
jgi:hypothetical protein